MGFESNNHNQVLRLSSFSCFVLFFVFYVFVFFLFLFNCETWGMDSNPSSYSEVRSSFIVKLDMKLWLNICLQTSYVVWRVLLNKVSFVSSALAFMLVYV